MMKVIQKGPSDAELSQLVQNDKTLGRIRRDRSGEVVQSGESAKVDISREARELQRIAELARQGDELRAERVKQLKESIAKGEYAVDAEEIAKSIIRSEVSRHLEKK
jgi:flagellar biosynthesis anti-sigma factor FlgM